MLRRPCLNVRTLLPLLALGCTGDPPAAPDAAPDVAIDVPTVNDIITEDVALDTRPDVAPQDVPPKDVPPPMDAGPPPCTRDENCRDDPAGRACDLTTGRCVACVAERDSCPPSQHCDAPTHTCAPGCRADEGCPRMPSPDGSVGPELHCNTATRTCEVCVTDAHCPPGTLCVGDRCVPGCNASRACPAGQTCCAGACVDTRENVAHCGACGRACAVPNGDPACAAGACAVGACAAPYANCDRVLANGCETHTLTGVAHCGACGRACAPRPNSAAACVAGACEHRCAPGTGDCDGTSANGCETALETSADHCGACGRACNMTGGSAECVAGACVITGCDEGSGDCDRSAANGCETNLAASAAHCGACGNACPAPANGVAACNTGVCGFGRCLEGFADCDFNTTNGCEVNTRTDVRHCGRCGAPCPALPGGATPGCSAGACAIATCPAGTADCDMTVSNGCEVNVTNNVAHCGMCGNPGALANATAACTTGRCAIASCVAGFGDCNATAADGCETDVRTTAAHCGRCNNRCPGDQTCTNGACACPTGRTFCTTACRDLRTDAANCGACARACPAGQACVNSACVRP